MAVDRNHWAETLHSLPAWRCSTCNQGYLLPMKDKIWFEETGPSLAEHSHDAWDPDWIVNRFSGFLQCSKPTCADVASISGHSPSNFLEYQDEFEHVQQLQNLYVVKSIHPAPIPIQLPEAVPSAIVKAVSTAASLLWASAEASGNQIRQAVELLMDNVGISASYANGNRRSLHSRIDAFAITDTENGAVLLATKWLGNSGSHADGLNRDDVLDAFDMLEYVLENRFGTAKRALLAKVAAVNERKGPVRSPLE